MHFLIVDMSVTIDVLVVLYVMFKHFCVILNHQIQCDDIKCGSYQLMLFLSQIFTFERHITIYVEDDSLLNLYTYYLSKEVSAIQHQVYHL